MYKIEDIPRTYGQAADILNDCDSEDIQIYVRLTYPNGSVNVPIDNFETFKEITTHDPTEMFPIRFYEVDGNIYLIDNDKGWVD